MTFQTQGRIFILLLLLVAIGTLILFYIAVMRSDPANTEAQQLCLECVQALADGQSFTCFSVCHSDYVNFSNFTKSLLIFIVAAVVLAPIVFLWQRFRTILHQADTDPLAKAERKRESFVIGVSVHFLPFAVLAMAMLFEYHYVREGGPEGAAAIGSVMILFILSELGALMLNFVQSAEQKAEILQEGAQALETKVQDASNRIQNQVKSIEIMRAYAALAAQFVEDASSEPKPETSSVKDPNQALVALFDSWRAVAETKRMPGQLLRVLLAEYFREERADISGGVDKKAIPPEVWPLTADKESLNVENKAAFIATNIGFYARFLERCVSELKRRAVDRAESAPCLMAVTNVLPSMWWNWTEERGGAQRYFVFDPIERYRRALQSIVSGGVQGRVFRTVLISKNDGTSGTLYSAADWKRERQLAFYRDTSGNLVQDPSSEWIRGDEELKEKGLKYLAPASERAYRMFYALGDAQVVKLDHTLQLRNGDQITDLPKDLMRGSLVRDVYASTMHGANQGFTEVLSCTNECFSHFDCRPDVTLIGSCSSPDAWTANTSEYEWYLALLTTMDPRTRTMLLTVVYDTVTINSLFSRLKVAREAIINSSLIARTEGGQWKDY